MELQKIQMKLKEKTIFDQKSYIEELFAQINELKDEKQANKKLQNQDVKRKFEESKIEG